MSKENRVISSILSNVDYSCDKYHKSIDECKMSDDYVFLWSTKRFKAYYEDHVILYDEQDDNEDDSDNDFFK